MGCWGNYKICDLVGIFKFHLYLSRSQSHLFRFALLSQVTSSSMSLLSLALAATRLSHSLQASTYPTHRRGSGPNYIPTGGSLVQSRDSKIKSRGLFAPRDLPRDSRADWIESVWGGVVSDIARGSYALIGVAVRGNQELQVRYDDFV